ncbi:fibronectin type III domain-containing protein [Sporomusa sp. KB1]|uniref:fibronectin type III domain-containing protein n=1 Tax=Sporomusa sp. KB1 TaxID=943346 RepID=UPI0011A3F60C|nr:fibronectin type III domain-containing protein [Sporomusa sp. KB1]
MNDSSFTTNYLLDAMDIDENGELKPYNPNQVSIPSPTNLTATAGDTKVSLSWTAITGATGYNVKRSATAGGPYETIATNVFGTSYIDNSVVNGTTYYYVVTAVTAEGESANSNEASATPKAVVTPPTTENALLRVTMIDSSE